MRQIICFNEDWRFAMPGAPVQSLSLPHTWNAEDGTDGGNDYYSGTCRYTKRFGRVELPEGERFFLEINGANSSADVFLNGRKLAHHDGGYSTFRVELSDALAKENTLEIDVNNTPNNQVYPQMADFTFYGGLYRSVNLIATAHAHFELLADGAPGIYVTAVPEGEDALVTVRGELADVGAQHRLRLTIRDREGRIAAQETRAATPEPFRCKLPRARLWHGRKAPYLYTATLTLLEGEAMLDEISTRFGVRSYEIDPERGFILNGESYPLRGVSRHQDRKSFGNALLYEHHKEDIELIAEMGATTIRLAHYQHAQEFYDLCDEYGFVVWAEIPYISRHMKNGRGNTISQMTELVRQNFNHPSIVVWGLSNEITMGGADDPNLLDNHRLLNQLVKSLDPTRKTVQAVVSMCDIHAPYVHIPDVVSYNHYFGWYGGDSSMNGPWLDKFHAAYPEKAIGLSEYGCEGLNWHSSQPEQGDYTEEYQACYHESLIRQLYTRPYLWATHVWNMFDFGCDARNEGGEPGQNHKGLVTFDRKYKKDAFYAYKAWLSEVPFVHICGKRYIDRVEDVTKVTVYSNEPCVELFVNGVSLGVKEAADHFFYFDVPNQGESTLTAVAGACRDEAFLRKVTVFNDAYRLKEVGALLNWFEVDAPEGFFSLNDKFSDIMKMPEGMALVNGMLQQMAVDGGNNGMPTLENADMQKMLGGFTVFRLISLLGVTGKKVTKEELLTLNAQLNRIKKL